MTSFNLKFHEYADIFPLMLKKEFESLKNDIQEFGLLAPIMLYEGKVLDGRNRYNACKELVIGPEFKEYKGNNPVSYVISENLFRRHLTPYSRIVAVMKAREEGLKEKAEEHERMGGGDRKSEDYKSGLLTSINPISPIDTARIIADTAQVGKNMVEQVQHISKSKYFTEDMKDKLINGETLVNSVHLNIKRLERGLIETPSLEGKYRIIYADPPWKYDADFMDKYGHVESHYPSMTIQELCDLPVKEITEDDAVLFLWVTSPKLEQAFSIIKAWGFEYKTSFVWDKVKHNFGYYNSVRHEFLLVCGKGSSTPDIPKLYDSVIEIERSKIHSGKPEEFRAMIDNLYIHGNRRELFNRGELPDNWEGWGKEVE
ncbi:hypothetical protein ES708_16823 [subsurface metagenome]